jgi:hypothetical protein
MASAVKWAIESATGIRCLHRDRDLLLQQYLIQKRVNLSPPRFVELDGQSVTIKASLSELETIELLLNQL